METPILVPPEEPILKTKELLDLEKLDEVLKYLNTVKYPDTFRSFKELQKTFSNILTDTELYLILNKLVKDEKVTTYQAVVNYIADLGEGIPQKEIEHRYMITYDGRILINEGGYQKDKELKDKKITRAEANDDRLSYGTIVLAVGTFGLVFVELLRFLLAA